MVEYTRAMKKQILAFVIMIVVLPLLAESIYAPGLPDLAESFSISDVMAEYTLSIYLFGMSVGVLFWGNLSDVIGRKSVVLIGFSVFLVATCWCYFTTDFYVFMLFRFLQAFGGAVSCVSQCVNRDVFEQKERMGLSAQIGTAVSIAPAIGALLGGVISQYYGWRHSFLFLIVAACYFLYIFYTQLPETKTGSYLKQDPRAFYSVLRAVLRDKNLWCNAIIIGCGLGIFYAFMSEGAFYCIESLSMTSRTYGVVCASGSLVYACGCRFCNFLIQRGIRYQKVMVCGVLMMGIGFSLFLLAVYAALIVSPVGADFVSFSTTLCFSFLWVFSSLGLSFVLTPCFANALENQRDNAGVAASIFAFIYNIMTTFVNVLISCLHVNSLYGMPFFFLCVVVVIAFFCGMLFRSQRYVFELQRAV
ncbi:MAG: Bcr/CflA family efflux MFS transporter [Pseudomonadota bacterium]|nr:Bcr/CflA family efflux MFS transporter [Pseudomonadota bacterium]